MKTRVFLLIAFVALSSSCGTSKAIEGSNIANTAMGSKAIIAAHQKSFQNFTTLAARMQVSYESPEQSQSITTSLRMEKDKVIWIKASILGITLAKVLITPDEVQFYESLDKSYFKGDFSFLSNVLGTDITFQQAQAILLGQAIIPLKSTKINTEIVNNKYLLAPKEQEAAYLLSLLLNPNNFMVHLTQIDQPHKNRKLTVAYGPYQLLDNTNYPTSIRVEATDASEMTILDIRYKNIDINPSIRFPFTIPGSYTQITLTK